MTFVWKRIAPAIFKKSFFSLFFYSPVLSKHKVRDSFLENIDGKNVKWPMSVVWTVGEIIKRFSDYFQISKFNAAVSPKVFFVFFFF